MLRPSPPPPFFPPFFFFFSPLRRVREGDGCSQPVDSFLLPPSLLTKGKEVPRHSPPFPYPFFFFFFRFWRDNDDEAAIFTFPPLFFFEAFVLFLEEMVFRYIFFLFFPPPPPPPFPHVLVKFRSERVVPSPPLLFFFSMPTSCSAFVSGFFPHRQWGFVSFFFFLFFFFSHI